MKKYIYLIIEKKKESTFFLITESITEKEKRKERL